VYCELENEGEVESAILTSGEAKVDLILDTERGDCNKNLSVADDVEGDAFNCLDCSKDC
jgi:hypothetical protein